MLTRELVRAGGAIVEQLIDRELRSAVVAGTDALVLADLVAETTPISSSGNVLEELGDRAVAGITIGSRDPDCISSCAQRMLHSLPRRLASSVPAFMQLGVNGGSVSGITVIVSDALADGTALLVDASQLLTASTPLKLDASERRSDRYGRR